MNREDQSLSMHRMDGIKFTMDYRTTISYATAAMGLLGALIVLITLFTSLNPTDLSKSEHILTVDISTIPTDSYRIYTWQSRPVMILRPGTRMTEAIMELNNVTVGPEYDRTNMPEFFVFEPVSTHLKQGCVVKEADNESFGEPNRAGFYDPCHMGFWDYSGRFVPGRYVPDGVVLRDLNPVSSFKYISEQIIEFNPAYKQSIGISQPVSGGQTDIR